MRFTVLSDNIAGDSLQSEWGLSILIEYKGKNVLLDAGWHGILTDNAGTLGIDLSKVDFGVLSHAHYDHGNGIEAFFKANTKAKFYLRDRLAENCYRRIAPKFKYIGLRPGMLAEYADRFEYVYGDYTVCDGVYLIPHKTPGLAAIGKTSHMYVKKGAAYMPDDFSHEQSLVIDTSEGLVIFNSCSHAGADNIIREVGETFSGKPIAAMIGGFHLFEKSDEEVRSFAEKVKATGIKHIVTGHCTGDRAFEILKDEIPGAEQFHVGLTMEIGEKDR